MSFTIFFDIIIKELKIVKNYVSYKEKAKWVYCTA